MVRVRQSERKNVGGDGTKACVVHVRFSADELAALHHAAELDGLTLSSFMRSLAMERVGVAPFLNDDERAIFELLHHDLRSIGVNLNGLTRAAHSGQMGDGKVTDLLAELRPAVAAVGIELARMSRSSGRRRRRLA